MSRMIWGQSPRPCVWAKQGSIHPSPMPQPAHTIRNGQVTRGSLQGRWETDQQTGRHFLLRRGAISGWQDWIQHFWLSMRDQLTENRYRRNWPLTVLIPLRPLLPLLIQVPIPSMSHEGKSKYWA